MNIDRYWVSVESRDHQYVRVRNSGKDVMAKGRARGGLVANISDAARKTLSGLDFSRGANWPDSELRLLRSFSRRASLTGSVGPSVISARVNPAVTGGLRLMSTPSGYDNSLSDEIEDWWNYYTSEPVTNDGMSLMDSVVEIASAFSFIDGDVFAVISYSDSRKKLYGIGTIIDIIPGCLVSNPDDMPNSDKIISGVEFSETGVAVAIHVVGEKFTGVRSWRRIPIFGNGPFGYSVRNVYHIKCSGREVAGMVRGLPLLSPVLPQVGNLNRFREAFIQKAVNEAAINFVAKGINGVEAVDGYNAPDFSTDLNQIAESDFKSFQLEDGSTVYLPAAGASLEAFKFSNGLFSYDSASKPLAGEISAACDVPPEAVMRLFSSSYSGGNAALNEFWRSRVPTDRAKISNSVSRPLLTAVLDELVSTGEIKIPGYADSAKKRYNAGKSLWIGPIKGSINPLAEYKAMALAEDRGWTDSERNAAVLFGIDQGNFIDRMVRGAGLQGTIARLKDYHFKAENSNTTNK